MRQKPIEHSVYIGRERLSRYVQNGQRKYKAFDANERPLGNFRSRARMLAAMAERSLMTAYQPKSPNLTNSPLFRKAAADPDMGLGYMTGAMETIPARKDQAAALERRALARYLPRRCRKRLSYGERVERRMRKRRLGGSSALHDTLRHYYTEGERAVLCVIAGECKRNGVTALSIDEVGDRAGVGRTTVQNAMHEGRRLGHLKITERPVRGQKSLTNLVEIASREWRVWIKRAPSAAPRIGSTFKNASTSKIIGLSKEVACNEETSVDPVLGTGSASERSG